MRGAFLLATKIALIVPSGNAWPVQLVIISMKSLFVPLFVGIK